MNTKKLWISERKQLFQMFPKHWILRIQCCSCRVDFSENIRTFWSDPSVGTSRGLEIYPSWKLAIPEREWRRHFHPRDTWKEGSNRSNHMSNIKNEVRVPLPCQFTQKEKLKCRNCWCSSAGQAARWWRCCKSVSVGLNLQRCAAVPKWSQGWSCLVFLSSSFGTVLSNSHT